MFALKISAVAASAVALLSLAAIPAQAVEQPSTPPAGEVHVEVDGGNLSYSIAPINALAVTLSSDASQTVSATSDTAWTVVDARGTGAKWSFQVGATDFVSTDKTLDDPAGTFSHTIASTNLSISSLSNLTFTSSVVGIDPNSVTLPTFNDTFGLGDADVVLHGNGVMNTDNTPSGLLPSMGAYSFKPNFLFTVPGAAYAATSANPYVSTLTFTLS